MMSIYSKNKCKHGNNLGEILIKIRVGRIAFEELAFNEILDALFDGFRIWLEQGELLDHLSDELLMLEEFLGLHDANNSGFDGEGAVFLDLALIVGFLGASHGRWNSHLPCRYSERLVHSDDVGALD